MDRSIELIETKIKQEELNYRLTGEYDSFHTAQTELTNYFSTVAIDKNIENNSYNEWLRYIGNPQKILMISSKEKFLRDKRKKLAKGDYEKLLRELIILRNDYANELGFSTYIDYRYALFGVNKEILNKKINQTRILINDFLSDIGENDFIIRLSEENNKNIFTIDIQKEILYQFLENMKLHKNMQHVIIHSDSLPNFYRAAIVPVLIPSEIHVLINQVSGLSGMSVFMHELGHALYYANISSELKYENKKPYNLMIEEGIAIYMENTVYHNEFLNKYIGKNPNLYMLKHFYSIINHIECIKFEERVYIEYENSFDILWNECCTNKYNLQYDWISPHFYVSEPGYFASYFLGSLFAYDLNSYIMNKFDSIFNRKAAEFIIHHICEKGNNLNYIELLKEINFL